MLFFMHHTHTAMWSFIFIAIGLAGVGLASANSEVVVVASNTTVNFDCDLSGAAFSGEHVVWRKSVTTASPMSDNIQHQIRSYPFDESSHRDRHRRHNRRHPAKLRLESVSLSDSGTYSCHNAIEQKTPIKSWVLVVVESSLDSPVIFYEGIFLLNQSVIHGQESEPVSLVCLKPVKTLDNDGITWKMSSTLKAKESTLSVHKVLPGHTSHHVKYIATRTIRIDSLERSVNPIDLECVADTSVDNGDKVTRRRENLLVSIEVNYPPTFTIRRTPAFGVPVVEGMRVTLVCQVERKVETATNGLYWLKDEKQLKREQQSGGVLLFERITLEDIGWYQCSTTHEGETFSSIGYFLNVKPAGDDNYDENPFNSTADYEDFRISPSNATDDPVSRDGGGQKQSYQNGRVLFQETPFAKTDLNDCQGCCIGLRAGLTDLQSKLEYYQSSQSVPRITQLPSVERGDNQDDQEFSVSVTVCSKQILEKLFWITPTHRVLHPGYGTSDGRFQVSKNIYLDDNCLRSSMTVGPPKASHNDRDHSSNVPGTSELIVIAKSPQGMAELTIKLQDQPKFKNLISSTATMSIPAGHFLTHCIFMSAVRAFLN